MTKISAFINPSITTISSHIYASLIYDFVLQIFESLFEQGINLKPNG
jgi:hypothetical protein